MRPILIWHNVFQAISNIAKKMNQSSLLICFISNYYIKISTKFAFTEMFVNKKEPKTKTNKQINKQTENRSTPVIFLSSGFNFLFTDILGSSLFGQYRCCLYMLITSLHCSLKLSIFSIFSRIN